MKPKQTRRCAIYTRKSSEEGLDQSFNSLDAQREACVAYANSQKHEGWTVIKEPFDDGGFSGGNIKRPALSNLIEKIKQKCVDIVIVYKVDRLSRSLADFAKLVELFDEHEVSFVSVTQQFNTSTSMGRLTLNVLLSFAQFEREITGERIRDKIAASKKKGMWMGGPIPLGYNVKGRKLIVNIKEAKTVRYVFNQYVTLQSVRKLKQHLDQSKHKSKQGKPFTQGALYKILNNPLYIGKVRHKDQIFDGEHKGILDLSIWRQTQSILRFNRHESIHRSNAKERSLLTGLLFDDRDNRMSPSHSKKGTKRYRYYVSQALLQHQDSHAGSIARVAAKEIETVVLDTLTELISDSQKVLEIIGYERPELSLMKSISKHAASLLETVSDSSIQQPLLQCVQKITIKKNQFKLQIIRDSVAVLFGLDTIKKGHYTHAQTIQWQQFGKGQTLMLNGKNAVENSPSFQSLQNAVVKAMEWNQGLLDGSLKSLSEIANNEDVVVSYIRRILKLAFLPPELLDAILKGSNSVNLELEESKAMISYNWKSINALN